MSHKKIKFWRCLIKILKKTETNSVNFLLYLSYVGVKTSTKGCYTAESVVLFFGVNNFELVGVDFGIVSTTLAVKS